MTVKKRQIQEVEATATQSPVSQAAGCTCSGYFIDGRAVVDRTRCPIHEPLDTGGPQGPPPTASDSPMSDDERVRRYGFGSEGGGAGAGLDLDRLAGQITRVLRVHSGEDFGAADFPSLGDGMVAVEALDALLARVRVLEADVEMHVAALDSLLASVARRNGSPRCCSGGCWRRSP